MELNPMLSKRNPYRRQTAYQPCAHTHIYTVCLSSKKEHSYEFSLSYELETESTNLTVAASYSLHFQAKSFKKVAHPIICFLSYCCVLCYRHRIYVYVYTISPTRISNHSHSHRPYRQPSQQRACLLLTKKIILTLAQSRGIVCTHTHTPRHTRIL